MLNISIVPYADSHRQEVIDLILFVQREFGIAITLADQPDLQAIAERYQTGCGNFWVALDGGTVVGTIALIDAGEGIGVLRKMFVTPCYRGKERGVGQALLNTLLDWARQRNMREIYLGTTEQFKAAQRFYKKNAFEEIASDHLPQPVSRLRMKVDTRHYRRPAGN